MIQEDYPVWDPKYRYPLLMRWAFAICMVFVILFASLKSRWGRHCAVRKEKV
jgi:hypothetical protein